MGSKFEGSKKKGQKNDNKKETTERPGVQKAKGRK